MTIAEKLRITELTKSNREMEKWWQETMALTRRLFIQLQRRPSTLMAGIIQPFIWLILFGALFERAPAELFGEKGSYAQFLAPGIIVFTAFSSALNGGLPVMFDREFGFLNRLLVAPLVSRFSIVAASVIYIVTYSFIQTAVIMVASALLGAGIPDITGIVVIGLIIFLIVMGITGLSLGLVFALPGHIELLAVIFVINLPLFFASTALAPLSFMAGWLQIVASVNPLTIAIEPIRYIYQHEDWSFASQVMTTAWGSLTLTQVFVILLLLDVVVLLAIRPLLNRRLA
ncbi:MAG: ABC transporter permease [Geminocystis sp.]|nr:ABC transporter permease [Geminocystis sp.]HIK36386.1 ABC transporter permease [Geminocystis sp. M7585_C2015_104]MCS7147981.1 ABC transporter permease [Geminocystis sp.]MCX8078955.1 ABC transporter permease [Geminocystis sp.]MDW8116939.1 ABC transporter permease [Geminocystis sp.]